MVRAEEPRGRAREDIWSWSGKDRAGGPAPRNIGAFAGMERCTGIMRTWGSHESPGCGPGCVGSLSNCPGLWPYVSFHLYFPFDVMPHSVFGTFDLMCLCLYFPFDVVLSVDLLSCSPFCPSTFFAVGVFYIEVFSVNHTNGNRQRVKNCEHCSLVK